MSNLARESLKALAPVLTGFLLGGIMCFMICLLNGCHTQKSTVTSVAVDSTAMSSSTEFGISNSEASAYKNLSLHFDSLEMWIAPQLPSLYNYEATGDTSVALSSYDGSAPGGYFPFPIYLKASGASVSSENGSQTKNQDIIILKDTVYRNVKSSETSKEDVDRTAVAKPPDVNWMAIIWVICACLCVVFSYVQRKK